MRPVPDGIDRPALVELLEHVDIDVDVRLDLLDRDGGYLDDLTDHLDPTGSEVTCDGRGPVHRAATFSLDTELPWLTVLLRPRMIVTSRALPQTLDVPLGVFALSTPTDVAGEEPKSWTVQAYDLMSRLTHPVGETWEVVEGDGYLAEVSALLDGLGTFQPSGSGESKLLPRDRFWTLDIPRVDVVNDLLSAGGFEKLWADWNGRWRTGPMRPLADRGSEWTYSATSPSTTVGVERIREADYWGTPNRVIVQADVRASDTDLEDVVLDNDDRGPASIEQRGEIVPVVVKVDAADQEALEAQAAVEFERLTRTSDTLRLTVDPNPMHWHEDVVRVVDPELGVNGRFVVTSWRLPLDGSEMTITCEAV